MSGNVKSGGPAIEAFTRMMFTHIITGLARLLRNEGLSIGHIAALHLLDQHGTRSVSEIAAALGFLGLGRQSPHGRARSPRAGLTD